MGGRNPTIGIPVLIAPATPEGRLHPHYYNSSGIFVLRAGGLGPSPFGINIDGTLILDFDESGVLIFAELLLPMTHWKGKGSTARPQGPPRNVVLPPPRQTSVQYDWEVTVSKDVQLDTARIAFGSADHDRAVELSKDSYALLLDSRLTGFWFRLRR